MKRSARIAAEGTVYLGRQPIYGANREIRAYELLYRRQASDATANFDDADRASADVMLRAFLEIGLSTVCPEQPVFINHTRHLLALDPILPPDRCVVEVLEDVTAERETVDRPLARLQEAALPDCAGRFRISGGTGSDGGTTWPTM